MRSKFAIAGHPLHPMLVTLPIGLFVWALVSDIVYLSRDHERMWYDISYWSGLAAFATALVAALPGFGDFITVARKSDAVMIATAHMTLNLVIVGAYIVAWLLQIDSGATSGGRLGAVVVLHAAGSGLLLLSGWLGGEMVYRHHLSIVADDMELARAEQSRHELVPGHRPKLRFGR